MLQEAFKIFDIDTIIDQDPRSFAEICLLQFDEFFDRFLRHAKKLVKLQQFKLHHKYLINVFDVCVNCQVV